MIVVMIRYRGPASETVLAASRVLSCLVSVKRKKKEKEKKWEMIVK